MGFAEVRVKLQGGERGHFGFWESVLGRQIAVPSQKDVRIGHASVSEGVGGVLIDRLLKVPNRLVEPLLSPSVPMMTAFQI